MPVPMISSPSSFGLSVLSFPAGQRNIDDLMAPFLVKTPFVVARLTMGCASYLMSSSARQKTPRKFPAAFREVFVHLGEGFRVHETSHDAACTARKLLKRVKPSFEQATKESGDLLQPMSGGDYAASGIHGEIEVIAGVKKGAKTIRRQPCPNLLALLLTIWRQRNASLNWLRLKVSGQPFHCSKSRAVVASTSSRISFSERMSH